MSKLSEILGVQEGQEFRLDTRDITGDFIYSVDGDVINQKSENENGCWEHVYSTCTIYIMIAHPELIKPITILTEQQITAIKGRIAEGTPWASREAERDEVAFWADEPEEIMGQFSGWADGTSETKVFDFVTPENSPVFLPDLIKGAE